MTRALLLAGPALAALPQRWMDGLLDRLRNPRQVRMDFLFGGGSSIPSPIRYLHIHRPPRPPIFIQHFVLRRSAGLASGFLAIVGAEPPNAPPALLPQLMAELLRLVRHVRIAFSPPLPSTPSPPPSLPHRRRPPTSTGAPAFTRPTSFASFSSTPAPPARPPEHAWLPPWPSCCRCVSRVESARSIRCHG